MFLTILFFQDHVPSRASKRMQRLRRPTKDGMAVHVINNGAHVCMLFNIDT